MSILLPIGIKINLDKILDESSFKEKLKSEILNENNYSEKEFVSIIEKLTETNFKGIKMGYFIFEGI
jgi:hypothetical protein